MLMLSLEIFCYLGPWTHLTLHLSFLGPWWPKQDVSVSACFWTPLGLPSPFTLRKEASETASNPALSFFALPVRVTESSQNYGHHPPMKSEGLRRPSSKTSVPQSQRLVASTPSNPDVSDLLKLLLPSLLFSPSTGRISNGLVPSPSLEWLWSLFLFLWSWLSTLFSNIWSSSCYCRSPFCQITVKARTRSSFSFL